VPSNWRGSFSRLRQNQSMLQSLFHFVTTDPHRNGASHSALIAQYYFGELKAARVFKSGTSKSG
jgi:hypothetical protein